LIIAKEVNKTPNPVHPTPKRTFLSFYLPLFIFIICISLIIAFQTKLLDPKEFKSSIMMFIPGKSVQDLYIPEGQYLTGAINIRGDEISYSVDTQILRAYGGSPLSGYTWSVDSLSILPPGTAVDPLTGMFHHSGGMLVAGTYTFRMKVSDGSKTATGAFSFVVNSGEIVGVEEFEQPAISVIQLPDAVTGKGYGATLWASGNGVLPWSWHLNSGELPEGLVIDPAKGIVRGTPFPSAAGKTYSFTISVKDKTGKEALTPAGILPTYTIYVPR
jgi:hypothetical protein